MNIARSRRVYASNGGMKRENIKIKGHIGTWYVADDTIWRGEKLYLLESEDFGDMAACLIVDSDYNVVMDDVWNGFSDLEYL